MYIYVYIYKIKYKIYICIQCGFVQPGQWTARWESLAVPAQTWARHDPHLSKFRTKVQLKWFDGNSNDLGGQLKRFDSFIQAEVESTARHSSRHRPRTRATRIASAAALGFTDYSQVDTLCSWYSPVNFGTTSGGWDGENKDYSKVDTLRPWYKPVNLSLWRENEGRGSQPVKDGERGNQRLF